MEITNAYYFYITDVGTFGRLTHGVDCKDHDLLEDNEPYHLIQDGKIEVIY